MRNIIENKSIVRRNACLDGDKKDSRIEKLRSIRDEIGFSQQEMANFLEISISGYSSWENGRRNIPNLTWLGIMKKIEDIEGR